MATPQGGCPLIRYSADGQTLTVNTIGGLRHLCPYISVEEWPSSCLCDQPVAAILDTHGYAFSFSEADNRFEILGDLSAAPLGVTIIEEE